MKKVLMILILVSTNGALFAKRLASKPEFEKNYIKMAAKGLLCGGVTLRPTSGFNVRVMSRRFSESTLDKTIVVPGEILSKSEKKKKKSDRGWVEVPPGGLRVHYDWAGPRPSFHYRIFCERQNERGSWRSVDCSKVLAIEDVKHNRACVIGPAGPSAHYSPLNMKT